MSSQDDYSGSKSPPPPDTSSDDSSSPTPPPPSDDSSSSGNSPPPPSSDNDSSSSNNSPPPPSDSNSSSSDNSPSPPPPDNNNNNSNSNNNNNNNNNNNSSPPPPPPSDSDNDNDNDNNNSNQSPPPPPKSSSSGSSNNNGSPSPPPPPPPPPPPQSSSSPHSGELSPPRQHGSSKSSNEGSLSNQQKQIIAGVAAGAGLLLLMLIVFVAACAKRKKRKPRDQMGYYRDNSQGHPNYYNSGPQGNWPQNKMQSADHALRMPPSGQVSSEQGWPIAPPPPPPMMSSSELSSAAFSGPHGVPQPPPHPALALGFNQSSFSYDDLAVATQGFARDKLLGQGGFGYVHKGVLPNGKDIAVKSLKANSGQGEREFQAEVDIISRVHHRHLVSLVGYCIAGPQRMLVYEFVANNTLEYHLHGSGQFMDFPTRHRIALGSAKGFAYLHEDCHPRIIHRDIKAANILIDENFEAKVADFGLAKLATDNNTHVSTRIMGTFGYLAPEYASSGKLTEKSDVYSFGVVLLELITGKKPVDVTSDDDSLVEWARPILMKAADGGGFEELVDPRLGNNYDYQQMLAMIACAGASIRHSARRRPKMSQIVRALEGDVSLEDLTEGMKLGNNGIFGSSGGSSEYDSSIQRERMKKSTGLLSSQEFSSSEYGMTGEYVHSGGESAEIRPNGAPVIRVHTP